MSTLGTLDQLCTCGRQLHVPVTVISATHQRGSLIAHIEVDRGYLRAHFLAFHAPSPDGEPIPAAA